jgi:hypothetical protein
MRRLPAKGMIKKGKIKNMKASQEIDHRTKNAPNKNKLTILPN